MLEWVDENVAIGSWNDASDVNMLRRQGIDLIIDARTLFDDTHGRGQRTPIFDRILREVDLMLSLVELGAKILVRCHHGKDRSPFVVMVYLSKKKGASYHMAYHQVQNGRPRTVFHWDWVQLLEAHTPGPQDDKGQP
jgi:hypothetical protein